MSTQVRKYHVPLVDTHNILLYYVRSTDVDRMVAEGSVRAYGSKNRIHLLVVIDHRDDKLPVDDRPRLHMRYSTKCESWDNPPNCWKHKSLQHHWIGADG